MNGPFAFGRDRRRPKVGPPVERLCIARRAMLLVLVIGAVILLAIITGLLYHPAPAPAERSGDAAQRDHHRAAVTGQEWAALAHWRLCRVAELVGEYQVLAEQTGNGDLAALVVQLRAVLRRTASVPVELRVAG